jgi:pimeloyl-ACP methyl ester carboxylesterase
MGGRWIIGSEVAAEGKYAQVGASPIYYEARGNGDPLLLIHGLSGSGRWWGRNITALAERHRIYIVDLAGFGRSRSARRVPLNACARFLRDWMDTLNIERAAIMGHSMGGAIAAGLAADYPERVHQLVLVNAAALPANRMDLVLRFGSGRALASLAPSFLPTLVADGFRAGPRSVMGAARELVATDIRAKLGRIAAPTLVVWGANDRLLPPALGRQLSKAIPGARLHIIQGAGHNPMWDRPAEYNEAALGFLIDSPLTLSAA